MIGVAVSEDEQPAAAEFFELCKTPWDFLRADGDYEIVVSSITLPSAPAAPLRLHFGTLPPTSGLPDSGIGSQRAGTGAVFFGRKLPIYGCAATFAEGRPDILSDESTKGAMVCAENHENRTVVRIGYRLFEEVRILPNHGTAHGASA
jgi:hypothetical protein